MFCEPVCVVVRSASSRMHTDEISCSLQPLALWVPKSKHRVCWKLPCVWPTPLTPYPSVTPNVCSAGYRANGNPLCLIISAISGLQEEVRYNVCLRQCWGAELSSTLLWESSHNPSLSQNAISIHYSPFTLSPRHATTCMDTRIVMRHRKDASGVLAS